MNPQLIRHLKSLYAMQIRVGLLIFGFYFTSKILLVKVHLLVKPEQLVKNT